MTKRKAPPTPRNQKTAERPSLHFTSPLDGAEHVIGFGYLSGVPYAALFKEDVLTAMIPRDVLEIALMDGWDDDRTVLTGSENKKGITE